MQKLNEGWDVLNLFDIVRLYDTRDGKAGKMGKTTISEAQLIGRGARYFPFKISEEQDRFKRKYDKNTDNELRILEELHYHSFNEPRYLTEIKTALKEIGMFDENEIEVDLKLKEDFKSKRFYKSGLVWKNERVATDFERESLIKSLGVSKKNIVFSIASGFGEETSVFGAEIVLKQDAKKGKKDIKVKDIEPHIMQNALAKSDFFEFKNLKHWFPKICSTLEFIERPEYLGGLSITLEGRPYDFDNISNGVKFGAMLTLLNEIERQIKSDVTEHKGTEEFKPYAFGSVFFDTKIKVKKGSTLFEGNYSYIENKPWYVFDSLHGTSEEKDLVDLMGRMIDEMKEKYREVYLVRNEGQMKIYNFSNGNGFEPDYLLLLVGKHGDNLTYQVFIEPKGGFLSEHDNWKNEFLEEIREKFKKRDFWIKESEKYRVSGVKFYSSENENEFREKLLEMIKQ